MESTALLAKMNDNMHGVWPTREALLGLGVQSFYWSSIMQTWLTAHVADLEFLAPLNAKVILHGLKPPSYITLLDYLVWPKLLGKQRHSSLVGYSKSLEITS